MSEKSAKVISGYIMLAVAVVLLVGAFVIILQNVNEPPVLNIVLSIVAIILSSLAFAGLFIVNPNDAKVMVLFGSYAGTEVVVDGEEFLILDEDEILAIVG